VFYALPNPGGVINLHGVMTGNAPPPPNLVRAPNMVRSPTGAGAMTKRVALGFFSGVRAIFGGLWFVVSSPGVWGYSMVPVIAATVLLGGLGAFGVWGGNELALRIVDPSGGTWHAIGAWALKIVFWLIGVLVAFLVAITLAQPLSGWALEGIARKQERKLGGREWPDHPFVSSTLRSLRVSLSALAITLPILAVLAGITIIFPPVSVVTIPLKFIVAGLTAAYDLLDYPLSVRGHDVSARLTFVRRNFWAVLGFGLGIATLLLIPGFGLLLLPFGAAGAARMVVEADKQPPRP